MTFTNHTLSHAYHRANRVGALLILMTICQYVVPSLVFFLLRAIWDIDTSAEAFGLNYAAYLCIYLLVYCLMMGIPLFLGHRRILSRQTTALSPLNLSLDRQACVVLCGIALCMVANLVARLFSMLGTVLGSTQTDPLHMGDGSVITLLFDLIVYAIVPAVMEEALLRGIILQTLRPLGNGVAVSVSAVMFALMHGDYAQIPYALLIGVVLGVIFIYTDDLRLTVIVHAISNALTVISTFLLDTVSASVAGIWVLILLLVVLLAGGVSFFWLRKHPLGRSRPVYDTRLSERLSVLVKAPLLWGAAVLMTAFMIVGNLTKG